MPRPAIELFRETFRTTPRAAASAPGRVNLIGEHTDYNGGPVLPIAIAQRTSVAVGPGRDGDAGVLEAISTRDRSVVRVKWQEELPKGWAAYVVGVLRELWALDVLPPDGPVRVAVASDLPVGAGLASSAALSVAVAKALAPSLPPRQIAGVAFRAEHDHVGVRCGVMDQTISALGKRDHAVLLECASLEAKQIPFNARLLLVDTGVHEEQARVERDLFRLERCALQQHRVIALAERRDRLIHHAAAHAHMVVLGAERHAGDLARRQRGRERLGNGDRECR